MSKIQTIKKGESLPFVFDRGGESIEGWVCTIEVKKIPDDTSLVTRIIPPVENTWPGFLTSGETDTFPPGTYRLIGGLVNSGTNEEEQVPNRFNVADSWVT